MLALRARALGVVVTTTGDITMSAYSNTDGTGGYARTTGSFITDGFAKGMELVPHGFTQADPGVIVSVSALSLGILGGRSAQTAGSGRSLIVGFPTFRVFENIAFTPIAGRWFVEEDYIPGPAEQITLGPNGIIETLPIYMLKLYGLQGHGITALYRMAAALLALFPPRTSFVMTNGDTLTVRTNPAPYQSQLIPGEPGWSVVVVTIPCRARSTNTI